MFLFFCLSIVLAAAFTGRGDGGWLRCLESSRPGTSPNGNKGKGGSKRQAAEAARRTLRENTELTGRVAALTESLQVLSLIHI